MFLFGAGTSASVNIAPEPAPGEPHKVESLIPAIKQLTILCGDEVKSKGPEFVACWAAMETECLALGLDFNIETVLSRIRGKLTSMGPAENSVGLTHDQLVGVEETICKTISKAAYPPREQLPSQLPHDEFARWIRRVSRRNAIEIFTTNYDVLVERSLEMGRVPCFDGFVGSYLPFFVPEVFEQDSMTPPPDWVRLWKIHGSVNWIVHGEGASKRIVRGPVSRRGEMIMPSELKYDESRKQPYRAIMDHLARTLKRPGALLVTCGYSFGDQHINAVIYDALESNSQCHVICLGFDDLEQDDSLCQAAKQRPNLIVLSKNGAIIRQKWGEWRLETPVDQQTSQFLDIAFDSNAAVEIEEDALSGVFRLGDFNYFCHFLSSMSSEP